MKENATLEQQIQVLNWHHQNGKSQTKTVQHFNGIYPTLHLKQPWISAWLKHELTWRAEFESSVGISCSVK